MRKYILILGYTNFTEEETSYWNSLSYDLIKKGYELFIIGPIKPQFKCHFFNATFVEKLDDVAFGFFNGNQFPNNLEFQKYLQREKAWYGDSNKDRLTAAKFQKLRYSFLLDELNPALVVLGNGEHAGELILKDEILSREIPLIYFERGCLPKTWHIDELGITGGTIIASKKYSDIKTNSNQSYFKYKEYYLARKETWWQQPKNTESKKIRERFGIFESTKVILFTNQLNNDTSNFLYSPYFNNNLDAFTWFCSALKQIQCDCFVLVKKHPHFKGRANDFQNILESNGLKGKWIDDITIFDCLEQCDLFCAVNSTSIYESMIYEKPVLQLGKSILSNKEIVYEIEATGRQEVIRKWINKEDFSSKLEKYENFISYMIDKELSFFNKECLNIGFNNHNFLLNKILSKVDEERTGNYPNKFIESRFMSETLILKNIRFIRLLNLYILILKELVNRVFKRVYKYFI